MKKVGIVSFRYEAKEFNRYIKADKDYKEDGWSNVESTSMQFNERRLQELKDIRKFAEENEVDHLLFPGKTLTVTYSLWDDGSIGQMILEIEKIYKDSPFIMEAMYCDSSRDQEMAPVDTGIVAFDGDNEVGERIQQVFYTSSLNPPPYGRMRYQRFWAENLWGHRIKEIDGIRYLIWVCGEINFLNGKEKPVPRIDFGNTKRELEDLSFDVFFNPAHTPMGRAHILHRKCSYLSSLCKAAIHTTNIPSFQQLANSSLYCFVNGDEIKYEQKNKWSQEKSWIMETIDIK